MTTIVSAGRRKNVMITDLDEEEDQRHTLAAPVAATMSLSSGAHKALHRKRQSVKVLHTVSGNFNRRSRSAELGVEQRAGSSHLHSSSTAATTTVMKAGKVQSYFNELLQAKDRQMEQLLQRISTLHKFNEQFADQNEKLRDDVATLNQRIAELQQKVAQCEQCKCLVQQLEAATTQCSTYEADVDMMQTLIYRLNVQIEHYQDKLRLTDKSVSAASETGENKVTSVSPRLPPTASISERLPLHRHTLAPLLQAYDEMLREKQELIQQYSQDFDRFTGELKRTIEENNRLQQYSETQKREAGGWREERTRLQAQLDVCRSKAEAQTQKADLAKEKLVEVMHCYEQKVQSLMLDMDHIQTAYARCKAELAGMKSANAQPQELIAGSLQECKQLLEQLKQQHTKEKQTLECTIGELTQRNGAHSADLNKVQLTNERLQRDIEQLQVTNEELRKRATSMQHVAEKVKRSRDRLKARLRIALQWAQQLEAGQASIQSTWDALKRLETIVKHKESQVRGLHARHLQEIEKLQRKLTQKEDMIRTILKGKLGNANIAATVSSTAAIGNTR